MSATQEHTPPKPHIGEAHRPPSDEQLTQRVRSLRLPQTQPAASGRRRLFWAVGGLLVVGGAVFSYLRINGSSPTSPAEAAPINLNAPAEAASGEIALEAKGYIIPAHNILVSPKVSGMIVKLRITESQRVVKDQVLAELEDTEYRADRDRAKANLAQARAHLARCTLDLSRANSLLPKNAISQADRDLARGAHDEAAATVNMCQAELAKAEWMLNNCVIRAPISGTILKKNAEEGSLVNPIALQGFYSLCEMADLSDLEVDLNIQERDISRIFRGQKCRVRAEAFPDRVYQGYVSRLMPTADRAKGAIPVRVKVAVPPGEEGVYLKPEMGAIVSFLNKK